MTNPKPIDPTSAKCTVVSLFPLEIQERKPGLNPELYVIPAAPEKDISILHVGNGQMTIYLGENAARPQQVLPEFAGTIANSIVWDFCRAQLEYKLDTAEPGLFVVDGHMNKEEIKKVYGDTIKKAERLQNKWFEMLVRLADTSWGKRKNHSDISELQRLAAKRFNLKREWLIEYVMFEQPVETA